MVINIDIKIADSDGKILHRFENRFDDKNASAQKKNAGFFTGKDFEEFLAEYLSCSGLAVRDKLMNESSTACVSRFKPDETTGGENDEDIEVSRLAGSELEYKIRIGKNKVLIGKVPLTLQTVDHDIPSVSGDPEAGIISPSGENSLPAAVNPSYFDKMNVRENTKVSCIDSFLKFAMIKAIEKYEANVFTFSEETDTDSASAERKEQKCLK